MSFSGTGLYFDAFSGLLAPQKSALQTKFSPHLPFWKASGDLMDLYLLKIHIKTFILNQFSFGWLNCRLTRLSATKSGLLTVILPESLTFRMKSNFWLHFFIQYLKFHGLTHIIHQGLSSIKNPKLKISQLLKKLFLH